MLTSKKREKKPRLVRGSYPKTRSELAYFLIANVNYTGRGNLRQSPMYLWLNLQTEAYTIH